MNTCREQEHPFGIRPGEPGWVDARRRWRIEQRARDQAASKVRNLELKQLKKKWRAARKGSKK